MELACAECGYYSIMTAVLQLASTSTKVFPEKSGEGSLGILGGFKGDGKVS